MATKKRTRTRGTPNRTPADNAAAPTSGGPQTRLRRSDDEKRAIVQQVLQSGNQSAAIKSLKIYPNQFYAWKKQFGGGGSLSPGGRTVIASGGLVDEAKRYLAGKTALLDRLRAQRAELDTLIAQLEAV
jgi:transposase-like protein